MENCAQVATDQLANERTYKSLQNELVTACQKISSLEGVVKRLFVRTDSAPRISCFISWSSGFGGCLRLCRFDSELKSLTDGTGGDAQHKT